MVQSATFDRNGVSIDNTELKGKSVSVDCSEKSLQITLLEKD